MATSINISKESFESLLVQLNNVKNNIDPLFRHELENVSENLNELEGAKVEVALAFTLATLFYVKMNTHGMDVSAHPIHEELKRIKTFVAQINQREKLLKGEQTATTTAIPPSKDTNTTTENSTQPAAKRLKVDKAAASRIIKHNK